MGGIGEVVGAIEAEQRLEPDHRREDDVTDDRGDEAGQQGLDVEIIAIEDLSGKNGTPEWSAKNGADPRTHTGGHGDPGVGGAQIEPSGQQGAHAGADLSSGTLPASGPSRSDGQRGGHYLDQYGAKSDPPGIVVDGGDGCIRPVTFGFGCDPIDEQGSEQCT